MNMNDVVKIAQEDMGKKSLSNLGVNSNAIQNSMDYNSMEREQLEAIATERGLCYVKFMSRIRLIETLEELDRKSRTYTQLIDSSSKKGNKLEVTQTKKVTVFPDKEIESKSRKIVQTPNSKPDTNSSVIDYDTMSHKELMQIASDLEIEGLKYLSTKDLRAALKFLDTTLRRIVTERLIPIIKTQKSTQILNNIQRAYSIPDIQSICNIPSDLDTDEDKHEMLVNLFTDLFTEAVSNIDLVSLNKIVTDELNLSNAL